MRKIKLKVSKFKGTTATTKEMNITFTKKLSLTPKFRPQRRRTGVEDGIPMH